MAYEDAGVNPLEEQLLQRSSIAPPVRGPMAGQQPVLGQDRGPGPSNTPDFLPVEGTMTPGGDYERDQGIAARGGGNIKVDPDFNIDPPAAPVVDPAAPAKDYTKIGEYGGRLGAWTGNTDKLGRDWDKKSERYKMLTVLSNFDPNAGLTPEVIAALNAANIHGAKFSGSKDKLNVENAGGWERFGKGGIGDIIQGFNDPNNKTKQWGAWNDPNLEPAAPAGSPVGPSQIGGLNTNGAIDSIMGNSTYNTLQQRLQEILGPQSTDPNALMQQLLQRGQGTNG